jgi:hypothetical protein
MAGNNNKKYLFRQPALDPDVDQQEFLPRDVADWFDNFRNGPTRGNFTTSEFGGFSDGQNGFPGGYEEWDHEIPPYDTETRPPGLTAKQPQVLSVVSQQVVQDPQGGATITVTFDIGPEQDNMRYELRLTK